MKMHKYFALCIVVLVIQLAAVLIIGNSVPADAKVPIHWNLYNQIDGWASKTTAMLPFWLFNVAIFLLMMFSGKLSPVFRQNVERYNAIMPVMTLGLVIFFAIFHVYMLLLAANPEWQSKVQIIFILLGAMFIFLGNILPKTPRNYIAGIKTPWTIYSDEIWRKTSRVGGFCFFILGVLLFIRGIFNIHAPWMNLLMLVGLLVLVFVPVAYSFVLYQKGKKEE